MAISLDATSSFLRNGGEDPAEWSHAGGSPKGVAVLLINAATDNQRATAVTYGGQALTEVLDGGTSTTINHRAQVFFKGDGVPSGTQTVSADMVGTSNELLLAAVTFNAGDDVEIVDSEVIELLDDTTPSVTMAVNGRTALTVGVLGNESETLADFSINAGITTIDSYDQGTNLGYCLHQTTPSSSDFTLGGEVVNGVEDDSIIAAIAVAQVAASGTIIPVPTGPWR